MNNNLSTEQYEHYISSIINRLIEEKLLFYKINRSKITENISIKMLFQPPEWYRELDDDTKYNVEREVQQYYTPHIMDKIHSRLNDNNLIDDYSYELTNNTSKHLKIKKE